MENTLTAEEVIEILDNSKGTALRADFDNVKDPKGSTNKYIDYNIHNPVGKKYQLGMSWTHTPLYGGVKEKEKRKGKGVSIAFRGSSGPVAHATIQIFEYYKTEMADAISKKKLNLKGTKAMIRSAAVIQTETESGVHLEDPIVRFRLPFDRETGKQLFKLYNIVTDENGEPKPVSITCTEDNIHSIIRSSAVTSGFVSASQIVLSSFGVSVPMKVQWLVVKNVESRVPSINSVLDREGLLAMVSTETSQPNMSTLDESKDDEIVEDVEETTSSEGNLEALRELSI